MKPKHNPAPHTPKHNPKFEGFGNFNKYVGFLKYLMPSSYYSYPKTQTQNHHLKFQKDLRCTTTSFLVFLVK